MADSKITALAALTTADPANDMFPVVDVSDTSMAASGTTKRISINNILACSPSATLASATITGDLTVDTSTLKVDSANNWVGVGTATPAVRLHSSVADAAEAARFSASTAILRVFPYVDATDKTKIQAVNAGITGLSDLTVEGLNLRFNTNAGLVYAISNTGVATWSNVGGVAGTAMTLNSTGLGVGGAPVNPLTVFAASSAKAPALLLSTVGSPTYGWDFSVDGAVNGNLFIRRLVGGVKTDVLEFDRATGNVGIGVQPSGNLEVQESGTGSGLGGIVSSTASSGGNAGYVFRTGGTNRWSLSITGSAGAESIRFYDINNSATRLLIDTSGNFISNVTGTAPTLATNSQMVFNLTSNTNLRISVRGSDGVTRVANITLA